MALLGEEIRRRLAEFAGPWSVYDRSERGEAQTFLNELFGCYGTDRKEVARFEEPQRGGIVDLIWPGVCVVEMKAPREAGRLSEHREQALRYWWKGGDPETGKTVPRFVVLCAFRRLEVFEPGTYGDQPVAELELVALPEQYDALAFLAGSEPVFTSGREAVTREAVDRMVELYHRLGERRAADRDEVRDFLLQSVWCMFAEGLALIPEHRFTEIVHRLLKDPHRSSADDLGGLFGRLNDPHASERPAAGLYAKVPYANGGLFERPAHVHLDPEELELLREAGEFDWRQVEPSIFGSLLEGPLGHDQVWSLGAHYTHEVDIQKAVQPTVVRPWRERIENLDRYGEAVAALDDLMAYVVLDPACGSGNFLYVAYRELRRLEQRLHERIAELRAREGRPPQPSLAFYPLGNMKGLEIEPFAVALARVTLWMGHKLAVEELGIDEQTLPLEDLGGIRRADALKVAWPRADAIIGNPPFHGSQSLRRELGDGYVEWLKREFGVGVKDYCVYWFRKAHDHLAPGQRAGLVGTNSVSQNRARGASLDYIAEHGGVITDAVSSQDWPGEAAVDVSIVDWVKQPASPPERFVLDGVEVEGIDSSLRPGSARRPERLKANRGRSFQGPIPVGDGFILAPDEAETLLSRSDADYRQVVRPYLVGEDIAQDPGQRPRRYIIDFGQRPLEEAMGFPAAHEIVRRRVKPERDGNRDEGFREKWWLFGRPRPKMRKALAGLDRYVAGTATGKRALFCWCEAATCPSNAINVFAFDDDYAMGVLASRIHGEWARRQSSTLEDRLRYTPTSAFETFPWPEPTDAQRAEIGAVARAVIERRQAICAEQEIGLTVLYNQMDEGAWADLRDLHRTLDEAVAGAYGWPAAAAHDPDASNARLLELNRAIASGERPYAPFSPAPG